jgi:hypothetical protein
MHQQQFITAMWCTRSPLHSLCTNKHPYALPTCNCLDHMHAAACIMVLFWPPVNKFSRLPASRKSFCLFANFQEMHADVCWKGVTLLGSFAKVLGCRQHGRVHITPLHPCPHHAPQSPNYVLGWPTMRGRCCCPTVVALTHCAGRQVNHLSACIFTRGCDSTHQDH